MRVFSRVRGYVWVRVRLLLVSMRAHDCMYAGARILFSRIILLCVLCERMFVRAQACLRVRARVCLCARALNCVCERVFVVFCGCVIQHCMCAHAYLFTCTRRCVHKRTYVRVCACACANLVQTVQRYSMSLHEETPVKNSCTRKRERSSLKF